MATLVTAALAFVIAGAMVALAVHDGAPRPRMPLVVDLVAVLAAVAVIVVR